MKTIEVTNMDGRKVILNTKHVAYVLQPRQSDVDVGVNALIVMSTMMGQECLRVTEPYEKIEETLMEW